LSIFLRSSLEVQDDTSMTGTKNKKSLFMEFLLSG
jgi:hypothetical protein